MKELVARKNSERLEGNHSEIADVRQIFGDSVRALGYRLTNKKTGKKTQVVVRGPELYVLCNKVWISYAFANILMNSIRAISDKKRSSSGPDNITFVGTDQGRKVQIDISDTGGGIPIGRGSIQKISDIWEQGRTSKDDGTGFGLVFVRDAIQTINNGTVDVLQNDPNLTLRINLPKFPDGEQERYESELKKAKKNN